MCCSVWMTKITFSKLMKWQLPFVTKYFNCNLFFKPRIFSGFASVLYQSRYIILYNVFVFMHLPISCILQSLSVSLLRSLIAWYPSNSLVSEVFSFFFNILFIRWLICSAKKINLVPKNFNLVPKKFNLVSKNST